MINHLEWKENINYYYVRRSETIIGDTNQLVYGIVQTTTLLIYKGL